MPSWGESSPILYLYVTFPLGKLSSSTFGLDPTGLADLFYLNYRTCFLTTDSFSKWDHLSSLFILEAIHYYIIQETLPRSWKFHFRSSSTYPLFSNLKWLFADGSSSQREGHFYLFLWTLSRSTRPFGLPLEHLAPYSLGSRDPKRNLSSFLVFIYLVFHPF